MTTPHRKKRTLKYTAIIVVVVLLTILTLPGKKSSSLKKAQADSMDAYPTVCLGGWQNPGNASGEPDVPAGSDSFSDTNSAVLDQTDAQIFCGNFQASDESQAPATVTLHFSWEVLPQQTPSVSTDTDSQAWANVLDATSTATSSPSSSVSSSDGGGSPLAPASASSTSTDASSSAAAPAVASSSPSDGSDGSQTGSVSDPSSTPALPDASAGGSASSTSGGSDASDSSGSGSSVSPSDATSPASDPSQAPAPAPASDQTQTSDAPSSTSFLESITHDPLAFLVQKTFADTASTTPDPTNFIDVSYSLDGSTWQDLSEVGMGNWQNFSVTIPVTSWDDINKLQVELNPLPSVDQPTIYLDDMWLEVDDTQTLSGRLSDGANAALGALSDLSDAVNGALDSAASDLTNAVDSLIPSDASSTDDTTPPPTPTPQPAPVPITTAPLPPAHQYSFSIGVSTPVDVQDLPWISADYLKTYDADVSAAGRSLPAVTLDDSNTLHISGTCTEKYYTILLFAGADDYAKDPSLALFNRASLCTGGQFSQTIGDMEFPALLTSGTYYLMVADQNQKGPWEPHPAIYPLTITALNTSSNP